MNKRTLVLAITISLVLCFVVTAEEGMWMLKDIKNLNLKSKGLTIDPSVIYKPDGVSINDAVINLGGGTAEFVSPNGLILTNHHVAFTAVQRSSSQVEDLINKGFLAKSIEEEIPAPGYQAKITLDYVDVTGKIKDAVKGIEDPLERTRMIEKIKKKLIVEAEKGKKGIKCSVKSTFGGMNYYLYKYFELKDIRIVYVPPRSIGNYGGDIDNWMWPRHTGDFSFLRAYVAKDGTPAEYSKDNVPYKPKRYLKVATDLAEGDFVFVLGYPGSTRRYVTSHSIDYYQRVFYPTFIKIIEEMLEIIDKHRAENREANIKLAGLDKGLNNALKNFKGNFEGLKKARLVEQKRKMECDLAEFVKSDAKLREKYDKVFKTYDGLYKKVDQVAMKQMSLRGFRFSSLFSIARTLYKYSIEKEKPNLEREEGYLERDLPGLKRSIAMQKYSLYLPAQKEFLELMLGYAVKLPDSLRIDAIEELFKGKEGKALNAAIEKYANEAHDKSKLKDVNYALSLLGKDTEELLALDDPFINLAAAMEKDYEWNRNFDRKLEGTLNEIQPVYMQLLKKWKKGEMYPDANSTVRLSYGYVKGYKPRDAVYYDPFTTLSGVVEKNTGRNPFDAPDKLVKMYNSREFGDYGVPALGDDVPVAFLSSIDSTGGNSGSPIMNARGELVGILFDGNWESIIGDFVFEPQYARTISVDIRYVLFITEKFGGAEYNLEEMGVK